MTAGPAAPDAITGRVFNIQRFSTHDGPGIRTTVFLKGCPLSCPWCHNPEGIDPRPRLVYLADLCLGCGRCAEACPEEAHAIRGGEHRFVPHHCRACGRCVGVCPAGAVELVGRDMTAADVLEAVRKDRAFYDSSGGGVTLSGGEPLYQLDFAWAVLRLAKIEGLHTCVDTSGCMGFDALDRVREMVDLFLFDVKDTNAARHLAHTGLAAEPILAGLRRLHAAGARIRIRVPIVPGCTDFDDNAEGLARLLAQLPKIEAVELMPYHPLGLGKLERLGLERRIAPEIGPPSRERLAWWAKTLAGAGVRIVGGS